MDNKGACEVKDTLNGLERSLGSEGYQTLFALMITDNEVDFSDHTALERFCVCEGERRSRLFYRDVRQSRQKPGCERNHVEIRKILPKDKNMSFDALSAENCSLLMSHVNSEPRPSLESLSPIRMLKASHKDLADRLLSYPGVKVIPIDELDLTVHLINEAHLKRGDEPLVR
ncbi:hypothetical protein [uncultured Olegusella sp.]|uniref:hypothetical protein n=1 Tax=uncultured Olegusella sp. TaxID=1979846 RepID=UPI00260358F3|nr:hypothetical protein [uncultured Olegusella sp.]